MDSKALIILLIYPFLWLGCHHSEKSNFVQSDTLSFTISRLPSNPIITYASSDTLGTKINGPSVIRVPDWIPNPLGKYYLYFAHHDGKFIRLAYADEIAGPWTVYEPGTLKLEEAPAFIGHIASPDVHIDSERKQIQMYFHGSRETENQRTALATSNDGLRFTSTEQVHGSAYFRVFTYQGIHYAIDTHGYLNRSEFRDSGWKRHETPLVPHITVDDEYGKRDDVRIRHSTVWIRDDHLYLFFTRKSDAPERILMATVPLNGDWTTWEASAPVEVLRPEADYEGIQFPIELSKSGGGKDKQQLRDPYFFQDEGKNYLFYSIAGEMGLAVAEIKLHP